MFVLIFVKITGGPSGTERVTSQHRVGIVLTFFSSRRNGDYPKPSPAGECAPSTVLGGEAHSLAREGLGEPQFRRGDIHCGTLYISVRSVWLGPYRLNMELELQSLCGLHVHLCTAVLIGLAETAPQPSPRIWALIRGRYWAAKIDDISL
jgi:hypothetical protein